MVYSQDYGLPVRLLYGCVYLTHSSVLWLDKSWFFEFLFCDKIFCSNLETKFEQKITNFGFIRTFKNEFFKNPFLQKIFPSNSEQVLKIIWMVKINSLTSRQILHDFFEVYLSKQNFICAQLFLRSSQENHFKFLS